VCLAAHLHLAASLPNFLILEEGDTNPQVCTELFGSWHDSRAYFLPPVGPGLGLQISDAFVREHRVPVEQSR
jgi:L-alanine-DL-glutamate epimerase-like enolase superfamily enzyme